VTIQNGGRCHGNQGAKNDKFTPNLKNSRDKPKKSESVGQTLPQPWK
jgi:hypothetical protein